MLKPVVSEVRYSHSSTPVHSSQLALTRSLQLGGVGVVVSFDGLLGVVSAVVALSSAGDNVVGSTGVDCKLMPFLSSSNDEFADEG